MARQTSFINLTLEQVTELDSAMKQAVKEGRLKFRRRLQTIWFSHQSWTVQRIAKYFKISQQSVWNYRKIYKEKGLVGLRGKYFSHKL